jgi:hypothetical protein
VYISSFSGGVGQPLAFYRAVYLKISTRSKTASSLGSFCYSGRDGGINYLSKALKTRYNDENLEAYDYHNQSPLLVTNDLGVIRE